MTTNHDADKLFDKALRMYASGHDNVYIELQFAELGIDKEITKQVIGKIKGVRKSKQRSRGFKLIIGGLATVSVAVIFTLFSFTSASPVTYVLYGLIVTGCMSFAKGLIDLF
jgi:hypothetical protein